MHKLKYITIFLLICIFANEKNDKVEFKILLKSANLISKSEDNLDVYGYLEHDFLNFKKVNIESIFTLLPCLVFLNFSHLNLDLELYCNNILIDTKSFNLYKGFDYFFTKEAGTIKALGIIVSPNKLFKQKLII